MGRRRAPPPADASHTDLDLAVDRSELARARTALEGCGFAVDDGAAPGMPARLVMRDNRGRQVDLHPLVFDAEGSGWQHLIDGEEAWGRYPAGDLTATGEIAGVEMPCLSAGLQMRFRLGYERDDRGEHDLRLLAESFGVGPFARR